MKKISIVLPVLFLLIWACSKSSDNTTTPTDNFTSFDRKGMLTNIGNSVIIPSFDAFYQKTVALEQVAITYSTDVKNEQKLIALQTAWLDAAKAWKIASVFKQGVIDEKFLILTIDNTTTSFTAIETAISSGTTIDNAYIETIAATVKGIPAIEYLLFDKDKINSNIIGGYTGIDGAKRNAYLVALCTNLKNQAKLVNDTWKNSYVTTFINADGRDVNSSLGLLTNKIIDLAYTVRDERIGVPMGHRTNNIPQPQLVEAGLSFSSLTLATNEVKSMENAFLGRTPTGTDGLGIDDLLDKLGAKSGDVLLSTKIKNQFTAVYTTLGAIPPPLQNAVINNKTEVNTAYTEIKKLQVLMEVDMVNNLGVLLTFSDNDGD